MVGPIGSTLTLRGITLSGGKAHFSNQYILKNDPPLAGNSPSSSYWKWRVRP